MNRTYLCIDLKSFYASVECMELGLDPLTTNLVVADESRTEKTICLAVTPSLKSYGIPGRARLFEVIQKVKYVNQQRRYKAPNRTFIEKSSNANELKNNPALELDYIVAKPRMALYKKYSLKINEIYLKYVSKDDILVYSIDEVFMDITGYLKPSGKTPHDFAMMIIQDVLKTTGITATAGIGTNMYLAKIAMDITAKKMAPDKDGVRIASLDEMTYRKELWEHKPLTDFWRVGKGISKKLEDNRMYTMGDIARASTTPYGRKTLKKLFGINSKMLVDHAWGYEPTTIEEANKHVPDTKSLSSGQVLHEPYIYKFFPQYNTRFIAINDDYDSLKGNTGLEDILLPIKNLINENYARETSRKVGTTARNNINKGLFISAFAPFGYKKSKTKVGRLEIDEEVAPIVRRVFDMFVIQDKSTVEISRQLNDEGVISPAQYKIKNGMSKNKRWANAVWNTHTVKIMLENPLYVGYLVLGKTRVDMYRNEPLRITKQEERNIVPNAHEPIVSLEIFEMAQRKLEQKKRGPITDKKNIPYIFNNLYCGCCGTKLVKQYRLDSTGKVSLIFYSCPSDSRGRQTHCLFKKIYEEELAEIVYKSLQLYVCMAAKNKKELLDIKPRPLREFDEDITRYTHIIENIEVLRTNVFDDFGSGKISGIEYKAIVEGYKEKQERYKLLLEDLKVKREKYLTDRLERQSWVKKLLKFEKDTQLTREMVDELIERINLSGHNKIEICYKFKNLFEDVLLNGGVCIG